MGSESPDSLGSICTRRLRRSRSHPARSGIRLTRERCLEIVYWFTHEASDEAYRFEVGDEVMVESFSDPTLNRGT
jgi:protein involved in polysaccharide export with SLBB domain